jgi:hypothetical protein
MSFIRKVLGLSITGALAGTVLGILAPPRPLSASLATKCVCDDDGAGKYKCNSFQDACTKGAQECHLRCKE